MGILSRFFSRGNTKKDTGTPDDSAAQDVRVIYEVRNGTRAGFKLNVPIERDDRDAVVNHCGALIKRLLDARETWYRSIPGAEVQIESWTNHAEIMFGIEIETEHVEQMATKVHKLFIDEGLRGTKVTAMTAP